MFLSEILVNYLKNYTNIEDIFIPHAKKKKKQTFLPLILSLKANLYHENLLFMQK